VEWRFYASQRNTRVSWLEGGTLAVGVGSFVALPHETGQNCTENHR